MDKYHSRVETEEDALLFVRAHQSKGLPLVEELLPSKQKPSISSGSIFVYAVGETSFSRWIDGRAWSDSLVRPGFLMYYETERRSDRRSRANRRGGGKTSYSNCGLDKSQGAGKRKSFPLKKDGLVKRVFKVKFDGKTFKVISYYSNSQDERPELQQPTNDPDLRVPPSTKALEPSLVMNSARNTPAATHTPMRQPTSVSPETVQQVDEFWVQPEYSWDLASIADGSNNYYDPTYDPFNLLDHSLGVSSPGMAWHTEVFDYGQADVAPGPWNEYDWDIIVPRVEDYPQEHHLNLATHGAIRVPW